MLRICQEYKPHNVFCLMCCFDTLDDFYEESITKKKSNFFSLTSRGVTKKYANFNREPDIFYPFGTAWYLSHMHSIKNNRNFYFLPQKRKEINLLFVFFLSQNFVQMENSPGVSYVS